MYKITNLFIKNKTWQPAVPQQSIICNTALGVVWNTSWWADNPRQILISCEDDLSRYSLQPWQLRENICISLDICQQLESGDLLSIWDNLQIRITYPCEPCWHLLDLEDFRVDKIQDFEPYRGKLWYIISGWEIYIWDTCTITKNYYPKLPQDTKARFAYICNLIPDNHILDYSTMAVLMWVATWYVRAMPRYITNTPWSADKILSKNEFLSSKKTKRNYDWRLIV